MKTGLKALLNQILLLIAEDFNKPLNFVIHLHIVYIFLVTIRGLSKSPSNTRYPRELSRIFIG
jgi:hypothetical protein